MTPWCRVAVLAVLGTMTTMVYTQPVTLVPAFPHLTFTQPVLLTHAPGLPDRVFVVQQNGIILSFPGDSSARSAKTFLNIAGRLSSPAGEQGLLGLAFHPAFADNGTFYVNYTAPTPVPNACRTVVARFTVVPGVPDSAQPGSEVRILEIEQPYANHNGGMIAFGNDGFLYIGMGDGGSGNDPNDYAQNHTVLLGKILRIDVDQTAGPLLYAIPPDNPYRGNTQGYREEIWASGFRNPWRFSIDRASGELWAGDVGQGAREEIDLVVRGGNYGWKIMEGSICRPPTTGCDTTGLRLPVKDYPRSLGYSVTGGFVYRGTRRPDLQGAYVYGDFGSGRLWQLRYAAGTVTLDSLLLDTPYAISGFGTDSQQELYILDYSSTQQTSIYRFAASPATGVAPAFPEGPAQIHLAQNYPNPFNPVTHIRFSIPAPGVRSAEAEGEHGARTAGAPHVTLALFDMLGRQVAQLVNEPRIPGEYEETWDASGRPSGIYICRLTAGGAEVSRTMVLLK